MSNLQSLEQRMDRVDYQVISDDKDKRISDLEAKLAESEKFMQTNGFKNWKEAQDTLNGKFECIFDEKHELWKKLVAENAQLKQQLSEKEAERELDNAFWKQECDSLQKALTEKEKTIKTMQESSDKNIDYLIEFASLIENQKDCNRMLKALERVKTGKKYIVDKEHQDKISFAAEALKIAQKYVKQYVNNFDDMNDCLCAIDNQIKQLKEI